MSDALTSKELPVSDLNIDPAYQRVIRESQVRWVQNHYDPVAFGNLLVGRRGNDTLWVVDGQQRCEAARRLGMDTVPCLVFASNGRKHEACLFREIGSKRKNLKPYEIYRASLEGGDPLSIAVCAVVEECGFKIVDSRKKWSDINCVSAIYGVYNKGGADLLREVLTLITEAWEGDDSATHNMTVSGVATFVKAYYDVANLNRKRLLDKLRSTTPQRIESFVRDKGSFAGSGNRSHMFRVAMVHLYNRGARKEHRLEVGEIEDEKVED